MLEPALLALSSSAVVLADARILALLALLSFTVVLADARSFSQCRLYRFDYIKFWFGRRCIFLQIYMCPATATICVLILWCPPSGSGLVICAKMQFLCVCFLLKMMQNTIDAYR
jgi:hypothetical protein